MRVRTGYDELRAARWLSVALACLMAVASAGGLWLADLYGRPESVAAMLRGYDLVTLVLAVPLLTVSSLPALRNSVRAVLVWAGVLSYAIYTYATHLFGTGFDDFFLIHVAIFTGSVSVLVLVLARLDVRWVARRFRPGTPVRWVSGFLMLLAVSLGAMWILFSLRYAVTGQPPRESYLVAPPSVTHLGYALDLALLVPAYALAAVLLWRRRPWGYVTATLLLVGGTLQQAQYLAALIFQYRAGVSGAPGFDPGELPILVGYLLAAAVMLAGIRGRRRRQPVSNPRRTRMSKAAPDVPTGRRHGRLGV